MKGGRGGSEQKRAWQEIKRGPRLRGALRQAFYRSDFKGRLKGK